MLGEQILDLRKLLALLDARRRAALQFDDHVFAHRLPVSLRIARADQVCRFREEGWDHLARERIRRVAFSEIFGREDRGQHDISRYALVLCRGATRPEEECGRYLDGTESAGLMDEALDRTLPEGVVIADDDSASVVLHCARDDLRSRGRESRRQDDERSVIDDVFVVVLEYLDFREDILDCDDSALANE